MLTKLIRAFAPVTVLVLSIPSLAAPAAVSPHHHRHHHRVIHKKTIPTEAPRAVGSSVVEKIKETAASAAPAPLPLAAVEMVRDVIVALAAIMPKEQVAAMRMVRNPVDAAREYVQETSYPGYTMFLQSRPVALSCLNPDFVVRLADALREARNSGIKAGVSSACRPPALGVGGMADKSESMHAYGLAVDLAGIGDPGSASAERWRKIAAAHGIVRPYNTPWEWNHYQPTAVKVAKQIPPARKLLSVYGPTNLVKLWNIEHKVIIPMPKAKEAEERKA